MTRNPKPLRTINHDRIKMFMQNSSFSNIKSWVFDLDNTLYHPSARLFDQIEVRMTRYVMNSLGVAYTEANRLRVHYWKTYGTTLAGLMREHHIDPAPYLNDVHDISLNHLTPDPELASLINTLPGRRIVYTNGCAPYAERVLAARGLSCVFDAVYGVENAKFLPKPEAAAFKEIFTQDNLDSSKGAMFEDEPRNLIAPHSMGMKTIHVADNPFPANHIHHHTNDLTRFLMNLQI